MQYLAILPSHSSSNIHVYASDQKWNYLHVTRQMMIIAGGEPELCCRRHAKREGGVYGRPYALRVRKSCPECSVHMLCLCRKVWKRACVKWPARKTDVRETQGCMHGDTDKEAQVWRGSLVSHLFQSRSLLCGCLCFLLSHRRRSQSCSCHTTTHCTVHMSMAWRHGSIGTCNLSVSREWDGHGRSISRSVGQYTWSRRPR